MCAGSEAKSHVALQLVLHNVTFLFSLPAEGLKGYFEQYGEVSDCVIMQDAMTKKPR